MKCKFCKTEILDDDVKINGFGDYGLDIQLVCPNSECEKTMSAFVKEDDFVLDE